MLQKRQGYSECCPYASPWQYKGVPLLSTSWTFGHLHTATPSAGDARAAKKAAFRRLQCAYAGPFPLRVLLSRGTPRLCALAACPGALQLSFATVADRRPAAGPRSYYGRLPCTCRHMEHNTRNMSSTCPCSQCLRTRLVPFPLCQLCIQFFPASKRQQPTSTKVTVVVLHHLPIACASPNPHVNHRQAYTDKLQLP